MIIICGANNKMLTYDRVNCFPFFQSSSVQFVEIRDKATNLSFIIVTFTYHVINIGTSKCVVPYTAGYHITISVTYLQID